MTPEFRCPNGHLVSEGQMFCGTCGVRVAGHGSGTSNTQSVKPRQWWSLRPPYVVLVVILGILWIAGSCIPEGAFSPNAGDGSSPASTESPQEVVRAIVTEILSPLHRAGPPGVGEVTYTQRYPPGSDSIRIQFALDAYDPYWDIEMVVNNALYDVADVSYALAEAGFTHADIAFTGTFPLVDAHGDTAETTVLEIVLSARAVAKVRRSSFEISDLARIADSYYIHPALLK